MVKKSGPNNQNKIANTLFLFRNNTDSKSTNRSLILWHLGIIFLHGILVGIENHLMLGLGLDLLAATMGNSWAQLFSGSGVLRKLVLFRSYSRGLTKESLKVLCEHWNRTDLVSVSGLFV